MRAWLGTPVLGLLLLAACSGSGTEGSLAFTLRLEDAANISRSGYQKSAETDTLEIIRVTAFSAGRAEATRDFPYADRQGELLRLNPGTYQIVAEAFAGGRVVLSGSKNNVIVEAGAISNAGEIVLTPPGLAAPTLDAHPLAITNVARLTLTGVKPAGAGIAVNADRLVEPDESERFSLALSLSEGRNSVSLAAQDNVGGQSAPLQFNIVLDSEAPVLLSLARTGTALTASRNVELALMVSGAPTRFLWAFDAAFGVPFEAPVANRLPVVLPADAGARRLFGKVADAAGNESQVLTVDFELDTLAPSGGSVGLPGNPIAVTTATVTLALSAHGASGMQVAASPGFGGATWITYATQQEWTFDRRGLNAVFARFRDAAGNVSPTASASVRVNRGTIDALSPIAATAGTSVTLSGVDFGATQGAARVFFGGAEASVTSWSDTSITALVPPAAPPAAAAAYIDYGDSRSNAIAFEHLRPWIQHISPSHGAYPSQPALTGLYLGASAGIVAVDGTFSSIQGWAPFQVQFYAPFFTGGTKPVTLSTLAGGLSNTVRFTYHGAGSWVAMQDAPVARSGHTAVWSGTEMIVYGGDVFGGGRYNPASDTWLPITPVLTNEPRSSHSAVWTGREMLVWGGIAAGSYTAQGYRYQPETDSWSPMALAGVPTYRQGHAASWTGAEMLVWGGADNFTLFQTGGRYSPSLDAWVATSLTGVPAARSGMAEVWTGKAMLVWGGSNGGGKLNDGAAYDPQADQWTPMKDAGAPAARSSAKAVWTGREMIVWGGLLAGDVFANDGARYFPATGEWRDLPAVALSARAKHSLTWTGSRMIAWGGYAGGELEDGAAYDPVSDAWSLVPPSAGQPLARYYHTAVWTGDEVLIWGGEAYVHPHNDGARLDPVALTWTPMGGNPPDVPSAREGHSMVWSGSQLLVWGGTEVSVSNTEVGARYDPATETWTPMTTLGAPTGRRKAGAVWTGAKMFIWGGCSDYDCNGKLNDGALYDPASDSWSAVTATTLAPRVDHSVIWTGSEVLVWGGWEGFMLGDGAAYDPLTDSWRPISAVGAPTARNHAAVVMAGGQALFWGGYAGDFVNTGAVYYPAGDTWSTMSTVNAPTGRADHSAVWTGTEMLVWGGRTGFYPQETHYDTGGRYDPATDTWAAISTAGAPTERGLHAGLWIGSHMWIWGGRTGTFGYRNDGGLYDPASDTWQDLSQGLHVPAVTRFPAAVWTGAEVLVWGGYSTGYLATGSRYFLDATPQ